jgi:hypothetical protein
LAGKIFLAEDSRCGKPLPGNCRPHGSGGRYGSLAVEVIEHETVGLAAFFAL